AAVAPRPTVRARGTVPDRGEADAARRPGGAPAGRGRGAGRLVVGGRRRVAGGAGGRGRSRDARHARVRRGGDRGGSLLPDRGPARENRDPRRAEGGGREDSRTQPAR